MIVKKRTEVQFNVRKRESSKEARKEANMCPLRACEAPGVKRTHKESSPNIVTFTTECYW